MKTAIGLPYDPRLAGMNLNHLLYFWAVGRAGSITAAAAVLGVSQPAISEQVRTLERRLGGVLLERTARGIRLTPAGERVQRHAEEIVGVCGELVRSLPFKSAPHNRPLIVGTADSVPKIIVRSILSPLLDADPALRLECRERRIDHLLGELALHRLDLVLTDAPVENPPAPQLVSFAAGSSAIAFYAAPALARRLKRGFPASLNDAPILLPTQGTALRQSLDRWFAVRALRPRIILEAEDRAQLHHFAQAGYGVSPIAVITAPELKRQFGLVSVAALAGVREDYFATVVDHRSQHPAIAPLRAHLTAIRRGRQK